MRAGGRRGELVVAAVAVVGGVWWVVQLGGGWGCREVCSYPALPAHACYCQCLPPARPPAAAGLGAAELYVVKRGEFEVLQRRKGVNIRVNMKRPGDTFGEVALMFSCPRSATVAATRDSVVWVLERPVFRQYAREEQERSEAGQLEMFLNSGAGFECVGGGGRCTLCCAVF